MFSCFLSVKSKTRGCSGPTVKTCKTCFIRPKFYTRPTIGTTIYAQCSFFAEKQSSCSVLCIGVTSLVHEHDVSSNAASTFAERMNHNI